MRSIRADGTVADATGAVRADRVTCSGPWRGPSVQRAFDEHDAPRGCHPGGEAPMRRSRRRPITLAGVVVASLVGALLAFIPRPSFSFVREMQTQTDTPLLSAPSPVGRLAHKEGIGEFRMIGISWDGSVAPELKVRTESHGVWSDWPDLGQS